MKAKDRDERVPTSEFISIYLYLLSYAACPAASQALKKEHESPQFRFYF